METVTVYNDDLMIETVEDPNRVRYDGEINLLMLAAAITRTQK